MTTGHDGTMLINLVPSSLERRTEAVQHPYARGARLILLGILLAGCKDKPSAADPAESALTVGPENIVIAAQAVLTSGPAISGSLQPEREARVHSEIAAAVLEVYAEQGQSVGKGALLARLDDAAIRDAQVSAQSAVRTAESTLALARRNQERAKQLAEAGAIADRDLETATWNVTNAEGALADAKSRLATAEKQLVRTEVRAPFAGIVSERQASAGDVVQSGAALFTIVDPSSMRLEASVPAEQLDKLKVGTGVDFTVNGYGGRSFAGRIERINPAADPATRQVRIYVTIPNAGQSLVAGLYAQGRVATDQKTAVSVPSSAVDVSGTSPVVFRLRASRVQRVAVELGVHDELAERVEVKRGVAAGDTLLTGTAQGMTEGTVVRVVGE